MELLFLVLAAVAALAGIRVLQMKRSPPGDVEPWDTSWEEDGEPLDETEIREAEDAFWEGEWEDSEEWRG